MNSDHVDKSNDDFCLIDSGDGFFKLVHSKSERYEKTFNSIKFVVEQLKKELGTSEFEIIINPSRGLISVDIFKPDQIA